jgi:hypothetical protein
VAGGFEDEAGEIEGQREGVREEHSFGGVRDAEGGRVFEMSVCLGGIAALGIGLAADAQLLGGGTDGDVACQADRTIRQGKRGSQGKTQRMLGIGEGTGGCRNGDVLELWRR